MFRIALSYLAAFFGKWGARLFYAGLLIMVLGNILIDVILFGTTSHHEVWPPVSAVMWMAVQTTISVLVLLFTSTHRARRGIALLLVIDVAADTFMLLAHVETVYDSWTLARDCLWLWAIALLAAGSPPKEEKSVLVYPSIERIP